MTMGWTQDLRGLVVCRVFLGVFEAGLLPGSIYIVSMWYKRDERCSINWHIADNSAKANRTLLLRLGTCDLFGRANIPLKVSIADFSLLAYLINNMDGVRGYHSWRWIFILEGLLTAVIAVIGYFFMHGFPEDANFLSEEDKEYIIARLKHDAGGATSNNLTVNMVLSVFRDWQIWCMYSVLCASLI